MRLLDLAQRKWAEGVGALVVKAIRIRNRDRKMLLIVSGKLAALVLIAGAMYRYQQFMPGPWARVYLVGLISVMFFIAVIGAGFLAGKSMFTEVTARTLDFQRIAGLSPVQILVGKALGEPITAYLLVVSTIPFAIICHGFSGIPLSAIFFIYLGLFTCAFMAACVSMVQPIEPSSDPKKGISVGAGSLVGIAVIFLVIFVPMAIFGGRGVGSGRLASATLGLFTPFLALRGAYDLKPWDETITLFGKGLPLLLVAPVAHLSVACFALSIMARRLRFPLHTHLSKSGVYRSLAALEVFIVGILYDMTDQRCGLSEPCIVFIIIHTILAVAFTPLCSPSHEAHVSWIWRWRGRASPVVDSLVGERSPSLLLPLACSLIGATVLSLGLILPYAVTDPLKTGRTYWDAVGVAGIVSVFSVGLYQLLYQTISSANWRTRKSRQDPATAGFAAVAVVLLAAPLAIGAYYEAAEIVSLSPIGIFGQLVDELGRPPPSPLPFVLLHGPLILGVAWLLRRRTRTLSREVDEKLQAMEAESQEYEDARSQAEGGPVSR